MKDCQHTKITFDGLGESRGAAEVGSPHEVWIGWVKCDDCDQYAYLTFDQSDLTWGGHP